MSATARRERRRSRSRACASSSTGSGVDIVDEVAFAIGAGEVLGPGGRVGVGQDDRRAGAARPRAGAARAVGGGRGPHRRARRARLPTARAAPPARAASSPTSRRIPCTALNPALRIGTQLIEVLEAHALRRARGERARAARARRSPRCCCRPTTRSCAATRTSSPAASSSASALAMAFACRPRVIVLRRADDRPRRDHPGARARDGARPVPQPTASPRCTSATTWRWSPSSPTGSR